MTDIGKRGSLDSTLAAMFSNVEYREDYLFYAHIIGQCSIKIRSELPAPAAVAYVVDHYNLYINPEQFDKFNLKGRLAVLKHEMLHILYGHIGGVRGKDLQPMVWNFGTDCALNQHINPDHLPDVAVTPESLEEQLKDEGIKVPKNESAEFYYNLLYDVLKKKSKEQQGDGNPQDGSGEGDNKGSMPQSMDSHDVWEESIGDGELKDDLTKKMIEKAQTETIKGKGKVPNACSGWLELHSRKSEVNWKKVLRGIVGNKRVGTRSTIMRQDRRFPKREDLRGKTKDRLFNLLVIADVSGSMSDTAITTTLAEVQHICDITKTEVDLIQVDSEAYEPEKLTKKTKALTRKGSGGTYLYPAIERANEHKIEYQAVVVLTDGGLFGDDIDRFHKLNKKIIWLVENDGYILDEMNSGRMQAYRLKGEG